MFVYGRCVHTFLRFQLNKKGFLLFPKHDTQDSWWVSKSIIYEEGRLKTSTVQEITHKRRIKWLKVHFKKRSYTANTTRVLLFSPTRPWPRHTIVENNWERRRVKTTNYIYSVTSLRSSFPNHSRIVERTEKLCRPYQLIFCRNWNNKKRVCRLKTGKCWFVSNIGWRKLSRNLTILLYWSFTLLSLTSFVLPFCSLLVLFLTWLPLDLSPQSSIVRGNQEAS